MDNPNPNDHDVTQSVENAQLEKLNLEINALRNKSTWRETLLQLLPAITVLLALTGFLYGIYQSGKAEQKARTVELTNQKIKIQDQIRNDLDQIIRFPTEKGQTISRASFLLSDLSNLLNTQLGDVQAVSKDERRKASDLMAQLISDDVNLNERRNVCFAFTVLTRWEDLGAYLQSNPEMLNQILSNHFDALEELRKKHPDYFSQLKYTDDKTSFDEPEGIRHPNQNDIRHFEDLVEGYVQYSNLVKDAKTRQFAIKNFQIATCNPTLTQQEFGQTFDRRDDPSAFRDCDK